MPEPEERIREIIREAGDWAVQHIGEYAEREVKRFNDTVQAILWSLEISPVVSAVSLAASGGAVRQYVIKPAYRGAWLGELRTPSEHIVLDMQELRFENGQCLRVIVVVEPIPLEKEK